MRDPLKQYLVTVPKDCAPTGDSGTDGGARDCRYDQLIYYERG